MIKPDRYTDPKLSVINISTLILNELNQFYAIQYDNLLKKVVKALGDDAKSNFPYALNFLFLLDRLKYDRQTDTFKSNEAE